MVAFLTLASAVGDARSEYLLLPSPVTITTSAATFRIARDGQLRRVAATPRPSSRERGVAPGPRLPATIHLAAGQNIDSPIAVAPDGRTIAFSTSYTLRPAQPDPARGALDLETVYLLRSGAARATAVHRARVQFAPCLGGTGLQWHRSWLLFSAGEGDLTLIDMAGTHPAVDLTPLTRKLPGVDEGFGAYWGIRPPGD